MLFTGHCTSAILYTNYFAKTRVGAFLNTAGGGGCLCAVLHWSVLPYRTNKTASATPQTVTQRTFQVLFHCQQSTFHMSFLEHEQWLWRWDSCEYTQIQVTYFEFLVKTRQFSQDSYNINCEINYETLLQPAKQKVSVKYCSLRRARWGFKYLKAEVRIL